MVRQVVRSFAAVLLVSAIAVPAQASLSPADACANAIRKAITKAYTGYMKCAAQNITRHPAVFFGCHDALLSRTETVVAKIIARYGINTCDVSSSDGFYATWRALANAGAAITWATPSYAYGGSCVQSTFNACEAYGVIDSPCYQCVRVAGGNKPSAPVAVCEAAATNDQCLIRESSEQCAGVVIAAGCASVCCP